LEAAHAPALTITAIRARLTGIADPATAVLAAPAIDHRARTVAIFATEAAIEVFALAIPPTRWVGVSDRFVIGPLLAAALALVPPVFVLALSENEVRLVDVTACPAEEIAVPGLPRNLVQHAALDLTGDRNTLAHLRTSEEPKERLRQFARAVDRAVVPLLQREKALLVLAAAEPLASIFNGVTTHNDVIIASAAGNADDATLDELVELAEPAIEEYRRAAVEAQLARFAEFPSRGRAVTGLDEVVPLARDGGVDTLFVDLARCVSESGGEVMDGSTEAIVRDALLTDATIVPVRPDDLPTMDPVAAELRYTPLKG
jgi:hypothetical protein